MKKNYSLALCGAHRGGTALTQNALHSVPANIIKDVIVVDPKEDRAARLSRAWETAGVRASGIAQRCEDIIEDLSADVVLLSIDTIKPMQNVLENSLLPTQLQLLCRGLGIDGPMVGVAGTVPGGKSQIREDAKKLILPLSTFIAPQSSENITQNPLNGDALYSMRKKVSAHSISRLQMLDFEPRDISGCSLNLFWGFEIFPLVVKEKNSNLSFREAKMQVLQTELSPDLQNKSFAIALAGERSVDFFVVESSGRRRSVRFYMPLQHVLPSHASSGTGISAVAAGIMLALGLMAVGAPLLAAPAMVTD